MMNHPRFWDYVVVVLLSLMLLAVAIEILR
jgi:hypothetical protein